MLVIILYKPKFHIWQISNLFTTRNQWFKEIIRTSGLTLIISTQRLAKNFTAELG